MSSPEAIWKDFTAAGLAALCTKFAASNSIVENANPAALSRPDNAELWESQSTFEENASTPISTVAFPPKKCAAFSNFRVDVVIRSRMFLDIKCSLVIFAPQFPSGER
jgi:hypothetical protein